MFQENNFVFKLFYSVSFFCLNWFFVMWPKSVMYGEIVEKFKETIQRLSYIEKKHWKFIDQLWTPASAPWGMGPQTCITTPSNNIAYLGQSAPDNKLLTKFRLDTKLIVLKEVFQMKLNFWVTHGWEIPRKYFYNKYILESLSYLYIES